jgi:hypothetical protein
MEQAPKPSASLHSRLSWGFSVFATAQFARSEAGGLGACPHEKKVCS